MRKIKESLEKYKVTDYNSSKNNYQSSSSNFKNYKIDMNKNKNKDSEKKKIDNNKTDKKKYHEEYSKSKEILNKKRKREEDKKDSNKIGIKKKYISDEESESDSDDKSYSAESEDDDSSESYSSFSNSSIKKSKTKIKHKTPIKKEKKIVKNSDNSSKKKTSLKPKGTLVYDLLERWWYALPIWPPEDYDTTEKLKENKLRLVKIIDWKKEPKLDKDNFEKCFELPGFKYVYLNNDGKIFDLIPKEGMPSYNNLIKLTDVKLHEYLAKALKGQLEVLEKKNSINEKELRQEIKEQLDKEEKTLARLKV